MRIANLKIWIQLLITIAIALALVWTAGIVWQHQFNREAAIEQARSFSLSMHDATMAGLTGMMVTGTIAQRGVFLDQIRQLEGVRDVRVLRGEAVTRIFGPGLAAESAQPDDDERQAMATGRSVIRVGRDGQGEFLRAVRPALAQRNYLGKDCTSCHQVSENTVLGVVSMKMSLAQVNAALERQRTMAFGMAALTCLPVLLLIHPFIRRVVTRPLRQTMAAASDIAAGDLSRPLRADSTNEIGQLQRSLDQMRGSLAALVGRVRGGTDTIARATAEIVGGHQSLTASTAAQVLALQRTAESVDRLTASARLNADSARQADELAIGASQVAVDGGALVAQVVTTMDAINASSARIGDIVSVIDTIAFQTNILALNAAVEASRAGEHGRGFAVVAGEVRTLAQRSAAAAAEIKALVGSSLAQVDDGARLVHRAGQTMENVVTGVQRVTELMGRISAASREQIDGVEQVHAALDEVGGLTRTCAERVQESALSTEALQAQATQLRELVGVFKLASPAA